MEPIFIFSQPRAGSTLFQRVLAAHSSIATSAEPWFLLPVLSSFSNLDCYANYNHRLCRSAILDLCERMPHGVESMRSIQRKYAMDVYRALCEGDDPLYFLDKTPRYYFIVDEIMETFPDAKCIFLWRNPLSVVASICVTWYASKWLYHKHTLDLYEGVERLVEARAKYAERSISINYEHLVGPEQSRTLRRVADYLELDGLSGELASKPMGLYGDPSAERSGEHVASTSLEKWKAFFDSPIRRLWALNYLEWIGGDRLNVMGYEVDELVKDVRSIKLRYRQVPEDLMNTLVSGAWSLLEPVLYKQKLLQLKRFGRCSMHR